MRIATDRGSPGVCVCAALLAFGCSQSAPTGRPTAADAAPATATATASSGTSPWAPPSATFTPDVLGSSVPAPPRDERQRFVEALERADVTSRDRELVHLSHTCDLTIDGAMYPVLDVREIIPHM